MKYNPRDELKNMMSNLYGIRERIRDIQFEISIHGSYNETAFTNLQLTVIREGLEKVTKEVEDIEGIRVKAFGEWKIKEEN